MFVVCFALCVSVDAFADSAGDFAEIARQSLIIVQQNGGRVTNWVVSADADPNLIAGLRSSRNVVVRTLVPASSKYTLPAEYLVVRSIRIDGPVANFDGVLGPGALAGTLGADNDLDCGQHFGV